MKQTDNTPFKESAANLIGLANPVQWIASLAVLILKVQLGIYVGWASPNFAWLQSDESPIPTTSSDISWLMSVTSIAGAAGSIFGCIIMDFIGSRNTIIFTYLVMAISWTCLLMANSMVWLYLSRIIGGLAYGILTCCFSIYLGEVAAPEIRGTLVVLSIVGSPAGTFIGVVAETYLDIKVSSSIYLLAVLIGVAMFLWLKNTPYYLMKRNDVSAAKRSIEFYKGKEVDMEKELHDIEKFVEVSDGILDKLAKFKVPAVRKSLIIVIIAGLLPQACGSLTVKSYMEIILRSAKVDVIDPQEIVIYSYLISVASVLSAMSLIDRLGRKLLVVLSSIGTTLSLSTLGLHFCLLRLGFDSEHLQWLALISLTIYLITYAIGFEVIAGTLMSEMFSQTTKSLAVCLVVMSTSLVGFVFTKSYQEVVNYAGEEYAFWTHALMSSLGIPYAMFCLIETKGKKFHEIQDKLHRKSERKCKANDTAYAC